jgi:prolyl 4-hydroxylase
MTTDVLAPPEVTAWIRKESERGVSVADLNEALIGSGWAPDQATQMLEKSLRSSNVLGSSLICVPKVTWNDKPKKENRQTWVSINGRTISVEVLSQDPYVAMVRGLLDPSECAELRQIATTKLNRSTTVNKETGATEVIADRSSEGMFFMRGEHTFISYLEDRMASLMGYPAENGEGLQILHYGKGGQYRPHHDYFDPSHSGSAVHLAHGGQRVSTMVMYLNTPEAGGSTEFPTLGIKIVPEEGSAVLFSYGPGEDGIPDVRCLHAGCPVEKGEKWIATKWVRQGVFA